MAVPIDIGGVRGTTRNVGGGSVVFASPASFAVGSAISFVLITPAEPAALLRFACSGTVTQNQAIDSGFETAATIDSIHLVPQD